MKKREKLTYREKRKSLRGRLQKSLTMTSFMSIGIAICSILILLLALIKPIGGFVTYSITNKIYQSYNMSSVIVKEHNDSFWLSNDEITFDNAKRYIFNENMDEGILGNSDDYKKLYSTDNQDDLVITLNGTQSNLNELSDSQKRALLLSSYHALEDLDELLYLKQLEKMISFEMDNVNIDIELVSINLTVDGEEIFVFNDEESNKESFIVKKFGDIKSDILIKNKNDEQVGTLTVTLKPMMLNVIVLPIIGVFALVALMTFLIVKLFFLPLIYNVMKPIHVLNKQLRNIAEHNLVECGDIKIEQRKPPTEIKKLIEYSNTIIDKLQSAFHVLEDVNGELEAQNIELDNQKEELEAQNIELDLQKEELEAQNHELLVSQEKLKQAQSQLVQSEKMASMGQLTAAIMHEINTPLGAVQSNNQMIDMMLTKLRVKLEAHDFDESFKIVEKLSKSNRISVDAATRVGEIIRNLRNFSRIDQAKFQKADISDGIKSVLVLTSNLWKNKVMIHENYESKQLVECYPSMINQVIMNLVVNAIHAAEKSGNIYIRTYEKDNDLYIEVKDDGSGIDENHLEHVFDNGFTTKPKDIGTGLGLSISKDIIEKHSGSIDVFNNEEGGATFTIRLPIKHEVLEI